ncbi:MAG: exodeoxyribonuclease VII large subunit [Patescibacteria group bacterium]|jgi:exodeoxyribonuclease VII large subunit
MTTYSVSDFVDLVRAELAERFGEVVVQGEVVDFRPSNQSLVFFDIKDEKSRLRCFMLRNELTQPLEDGMEIRVLGVPSLFKKNGGFHMRVSEIELVGEGALRKAFLLLQKKLQQEGLFAPEHKQQLPRFPFHIGLITSPDAAAYTDVLRVLENRFGGLAISFYPAQVQGAGSVRQVASALTAAGARTDLDVIILTRGGGSMEDLQSFNAEEVARAIFASKVPVVVGVGHERDVTIADYVADVRAATPSNAAELVVLSRREILGNLIAEQHQLAHAMERTTQRTAQRLHSMLQALAQLLSRPFERLRSAETGLRYAWRNLGERAVFASEGVVASAGRMQQALQRLVERYGAALRQHKAALVHLSPDAIVKRGYSITYLTEKGKRTILKSTTRVSRGSHLTTRLSDGTIESTVE